MQTRDQATGNEDLLELADSHDTISVRGARENNLKDVDVDIPKRRLTVFTGVSGSGKSTLVDDTLYAAVARQLYRAHDEAAGHGEIVGIE